MAQRELWRALALGSGPAALLAAGIGYWVNDMPMIAAAELACAAWLAVLLYSLS